MTYKLFLVETFSSPRISAILMLSLCPPSLANLTGDDDDPALSELVGESPKNNCP